jgi:hypothetical protein
MKYRIEREGLSMTITAQSRAEAEGDFAGRLAQRNGEVRTTEDIAASAMTPAALAVKRSTKGIKE